MGIIAKKKICKSCGKEKYLWSRGRCKECATKEDSAGKRIQRTAPVSVSSVITHKHKYLERKQWFDERSLELTGVCAACGAATCKGDPKFEKFSIAHIFPKAYFTSVEHHPMNFIELCFWEFNCHGNYDNQGIETIIDTPAWPVMVERFHAFEHLLTKEEKARKFYHKFKQLVDESRDRLQPKIED